MIECTLQEAMIKSKSGGRCWPKSFKNAIDGGCGFNAQGEFVFLGSGEPVKFWESYIEEPWIYEPPRESAFQKWSSNTYHLAMTPSKFSYDELVHHRKTGWNAAIDEILNLPCESVNNMGQLISKETIKLLKEP